MQFHQTTFLSNQLIKHMKNKVTPLFESKGVTDEDILADENVEIEQSK